MVESARQHSMKSVSGSQSQSGIPGHSCASAQASVGRLMPLEELGGPHQRGEHQQERRLGKQTPLSANLQSPLHAVQWCADLPPLCPGAGAALLGRRGPGEGQCKHRVAGWGPTTRCL